MNLTNLNTYDHYGYAAIAVLGTFAAVWAIYWLMARSPWRQQIRGFAGVVPPFINIIGVLFGLTLAFLANDTWIAHDRATTSVHREADALRSLMVLTSHLESPLRDELRQALTHYAQANADEWTLLARREVSDAATAKSDELLRRFSSQELAKLAGVNIQGLMLRKMTDLRDERDLRISLSQTHINPLKWLGMAFLGLLTLISVAVVHAENPKAALVAILLFAFAAAPTAAIVLVQGNPFQQPSAVSFRQSLMRSRGRTNATRLSASLQAFEFWCHSGISLQLLKEVQSLRPGAVAGIDVDMPGGAYVQEITAPDVSPSSSDPVIHPGVVATGDDQTRERQAFFQQNMRFAKTIWIRRCYEQGATDFFLTDESRSYAGQAAEAVGDDPDWLAGCLDGVANPGRPVRKAGFFPVGLFDAARVR